MKNFLLLVFCFLMLFSSCSKYRKGVEETQVNLSSGATYYCSQADQHGHSSGVPYQRDLKNYISVYWEDKTCKALGYTKRNSDENVRFESKEGSTTPGKNGYWANSGGASGGGNTPSFCQSAYVDPWPADYQISSQCESAYTYRCSGYSLTSQQVQYVCNTYNDWKPLTPGLPDCSYCK